MASVLEISKKLNREFKNNNLNTVAELQPEYTRCPMGMLGFDYPLFGGLVLGRVVQFSGKESSGKTTAAMAFVSSFQRIYPEKMCVFIDVEHTLDLPWVAQATGVDLTKLVYVNPENMTGEQILDVAHEYFQADDIGVVVLDSVAALATGQIYENDVDKETFANISKSLGRFFVKALDKISSSQGVFLPINQVRPVIGARVPAFAEPCGKALAFYTSTLLRFGTRTYTHGDVVDSRTGEKADGIRLWFEIRKNKTATTQRGGGFITIRYDTGLDWLYDLLDVAMKYEFVERPTLQRYRLIDLETGEIYTDEEGKQLEFVGKDKLRTYLRENVSFQKKYIDMITKHISQKNNKYGSLLDERQLSEMGTESDQIEKASGY